MRALTGAYYWGALHAGLFSIGLLVDAGDFGLCAVVSLLVLGLVLSSVSPED